MLNPFTQTSWGLGVLNKCAALGSPRNPLPGSLSERFSNPETLGREGILSLRQLDRYHGNQMNSKVLNGKWEDIKEIQESKRKAAALFYWVLEASCYLRPGTHKGTTKTRLSSPSFTN